MEKTKKLNTTFIFGTLKGSLIATATSLVGILFFAFIMSI